MVERRRKPKPRRESSQIIPVESGAILHKIADEQPYIYRLTYLGIEAQRRGSGVQFSAEVSRLIFSGTKDWHLGDHLKNAANRAGLDFDEMEKVIKSPETYRNEVEENQKALEKAGHWGVPTFVFDEEPFFGQDRIDTLCWRLEKEGLARKN